MVKLEYHTSCPVVSLGKNIGAYTTQYYCFTDCELLILNMLSVDPEKRLGLPQILLHKWMTEV